MSTMSMVGSSMMRRQSPVLDSKPNLLAPSAASSSVASAMTALTGMAGAGQKNIGMDAYAMEWALPMNPAPMRPTRSSRMVEGSVS